PQDKALAFSGDANEPDSSSLPSEVALGYTDRAKGRSNGVAPDDSSAPTTDRWGADSKLWPSLISAGFGMMASRSPYLGVAIGEGGEAGVRSSNDQQEVQYKAQQDAIKNRLEKDREDRASRQQQVSEINQPIMFDNKGNPVVNPQYIKAKEAVEKSFKPIWGKIDETEGGREIYGWI